MQCVSSALCVFPCPAALSLIPIYYLPDAPGPFSAVFGCYPYRKDDVSAGNMRYQHDLAQRGYGGIRIDVRGTGSSGGVAGDEYSVQEQLDGKAYCSRRWAKLVRRHLL